MSTGASATQETPENIERDLDSCKVVDYKVQFLEAPSNLPRCFQHALPSINVHDLKTLPAAPLQHNLFYTNNGPCCFDVFEALRYRTLAAAIGVSSRTAAGALEFSSGAFFGSANMGKNRVLIHSTLRLLKAI